MFDAIANIKVSEVLETKSVGRPVNSHVVKAVPSREIDIEHMREQVHGVKANEGDKKQK